MYVTLRYMKMKDWIRMISSSKMLHTAYPRMPSGYHNDSQWAIKPAISMNSRSPAKMLPNSRSARLTGWVIISITNIKTLKGARSTFISTFVDVNGADTAALKY